MSQETHINPDLAAKTLIDLFSTAELIAALFRRKTLAGVLIYSLDEHRHANQLHKEFKVVTTLTANDTIKVTSSVLRELITEASKHEG